MFKMIWQTQLTDVNTRDVEGVGRIRHGVRGDAYRWVLLGEADGTDLVVGDVVYHKLSETTSALQKVYKALTANLGYMAGVIMGATLEGGGSDTPANTNKGYGWVQILGDNASVKVSGATTGGTDIAAGDYLYGVTAVTHLIRDAATQARYRRNVQILEAVGTTTTPAAAVKKGYINCL